MENAYLTAVIARPLTQCLSDMVCIKPPSDPIEWIAQWLYRYIDNELYFHEKTLFLKSLPKLQLQMAQERVQRCKHSEAIRAHRISLIERLSLYAESSPLKPKNLILLAGDAEKYPPKLKLQYQQLPEIREIKNDELDKISDIFVIGEGGEVSGSSSFVGALHDFIERPDSDTQLDRLSWQLNESPQKADAFSEFIARRISYASSLYSTEQSSNRSSAYLKRKSHDTGNAHTERDNAQTERGNTHTERGNANTERSSALTDRSSAYTDKSSAYTNKSSAYTDRSSAYTNKSSAYTDRSSAYTDRNSAYAERRSYNADGSAHSSGRDSFTGDNEDPEAPPIDLEAKQVVAMIKVKKFNKRLKKNLKAIVMPVTSHWSLDCKAGLICHHSILGVMRGRPPLIPPETPEWWERQHYLEQTLYDHEIYSVAKTEYKPRKEHAGYESLSYNDFVNEGPWLQEGNLRGMQESLQALYRMEDKKA